MKEAYCTFEIAKLLKKKGFDTFLPFGFNSTWHTPEPRKFIKDDGRGGFYDDKENWISCPTHQMAMAWLRDVHKVLIVIDAYHADHWEGYIDCFEINIYSHASTIIVPNEIAHHTDYTEAVEAAIKYSLEKLI